jgi:CYTH domain-containing protein
MSQEIERKFLVQGEYKQYAHASHHIAQGYICRAHGRTVRIRLRDDRGFITIKGPSADGGLSRYEWEKEISRSEALELLKLCEPTIVEKTRWLVTCGRHTFEVDEFHGDNAGLVVAEVELSAPDEAYEAPPFLGQEVTGDARYYNSYLSAHPYTKWEG